MQPAPLSFYEQRIYDVVFNNGLSGFLVRIFNNGLIGLNGFLVRIFNNGLIGLNGFWVRMLNSGLNGCRYP